jgi:hypothetical protein
MASAFYGCAGTRNKYNTIQYNRFKNTHTEKMKLKIKDNILPGAVQSKTRGRTILEYILEFYAVA